jgi:hypothetical protein
MDNKKRKLLAYAIASSAVNIINQYNCLYLNDPYNESKIKRAKMRKESF